MEVHGNTVATPGASLEPCGGMFLSDWVAAGHDKGTTSVRWPTDAGLVNQATLTLYADPGAESCVLFRRLFLSLSLFWVSHHSHLSISISLAIPPAPCPCHPNCVMVQLGTAVCGFDVWGAGGASTRIRLDSSFEDLAVQPPPPSKQKNT